MFCPQRGVFEVLVVLTVTGAQPVVLLTENAATGVGFTQITMVVSSPPHSSVPVCSLMEYDPGVVKLTWIFVVPLVQPLGTVPGADPSVPELSVQPVAGVIVHTWLPAVHAALPLGGTTDPAVPILVKETIVFWQTVSLGEIENAASDFFEIRIPPIVPGVSPQGLDMI